MFFEFASEFHWTGENYEATPIFVRQFCWDFIMRRRRVQNSNSDVSLQREGNVTRVKW